MTAYLVVPLRCIPPRLGLKPNSRRVVVPVVTGIDSRQQVRAGEFVDELARLVGGEITFHRNGGNSTSGILVHAEADETVVDGRALPVVHVLMDRKTRDGSAPAMVSLVLGGRPDEDFFWPDCPVDITTAGATRAFLLRRSV